MLQLIIYVMLIQVNIIFKIKTGIRCNNIIYILDSTSGDSEFMDLSSTIQKIGIGEREREREVLFNIFINDIPKSRNTSLAIYADDTAVYTTSWSTVLLARRLQAHIDDILQFFADWRMSINADKTEAIVFTRRKLKHNPPPPIRVLNHTISWTNRVKYLGVILDSGLRWGPAIGCLLFEYGKVYAWPARER